MTKLLIEEFQPRVEAGASGQNAVVDALQQQFGKRLTDVDVAVVGNKLIDITVKIDGKPVKFEVKNVRGRPRTAIYNTTVWLEEPQSLKTPSRPTVIDKFVSYLTGNQFHTFNEWIAAARKDNQEIGFPGQVGVKNKAGKIPNPKTTSDPSLISHVRNNFIKRLKQQEISYFVIFYEPSSTAYFYYTGYGDNVLNVRRTPSISSVMIDTYGDPSSKDKDMDDPTYVELPGKNRMRVALKATFKL